MNQVRILTDRFKPLSAIEKLFNAVGLFGVFSAILGMTRSVLLSSKPLNKLFILVSGKLQYLDVNVESVFMHARRGACIVSIRYYDWCGRTIKGPYRYTHMRKGFGHVWELFGDEGGSPSSQRLYLSPPKGAVFVRLRFRTPLQVSVGMSSKLQLRRAGVVMIDQEKIDYSRDRFALEQTYLQYKKSQNVAGAQQVLSRLIYLWPVAHYLSEQRILNDVTTIIRTLRITTGVKDRVGGKEKSEEIYTLESQNSYVGDIPLSKWLELQAIQIIASLNGEVPKTIYLHTGSEMLKHLLIARTMQTMFGCHVMLGVELGLEQNMSLGSWLVFESFEKFAESRFGILCLSHLDHIMTTNIQMAEALAEQGIDSNRISIC